MRGVAPAEEDDDFDFEQVMGDTVPRTDADLNTEASDSRTKRIQRKLEGLGAWRADLEFDHAAGSRVLSARL